jgi:hypothetical protein
MKHDLNEAQEMVAERRREAERIKLEEERIARRNTTRSASHIGINNLRRAMKAHGHHPGRRRGRYLWCKRCRLTVRPSGQALPTCRGAGPATTPPSPTTVEVRAIQRDLHLCGTALRDHKLEERRQQREARGQRVAQAVRQHWKEVTEAAPRPPRKPRPKRSAASEDRDPIRARGLR